MSISDRIAVMRGGKVEQYGTPEEIYLRPVTRYVATFIGSPRMDLLDGEFARVDGAAVFRVGAAAFRLPEDVAAAAADAAGGAALQLGIRPENIVIGDDGVAATVGIVQPIGPSTYVTVNWEGGSLTARIPGISAFRPGQTVHVTLDPAGLLFFDNASGLRLESRRESRDVTTVGL